MNTPIIFDPTIADLKAIIASTALITVNDLSDETQMSLVHDTRISLRDARVKIEKSGKKYREDAIKYQKDVLIRERELIAIITPEETRLKALEDEASTIKERAARIALLPMRREQLDNLKDGIQDTDEALLDMENEAFIIYLNKRVSDKNEKDRQEIEAEKSRMARAEEDKRIAEEARIAERNRIEAQQKADEERRVQAEAQKRYDADALIAKNKREAEISAQKLIDDAKAEAERVIAVAKAQEEARIREIEVKADQAKAEADKIEADKIFTEWKMNHGWTEEEADQYKTVHVDGAIELWKLVAVY